MAGLTEADREALLSERGTTEPAGLGRRSFLAASAGLGVLALVAGGAGRLLSERFDVSALREKIKLPFARKPLPEIPAGVQLDAPGVTPFFTKNADFYRIDTALVAPQVPVDTWSLTIKGMVDEELTFTYDELLARDVDRVGHHPHLRLERDRRPARRAPPGGSASRWPSCWTRPACRRVPTRSSGGRSTASPPGSPFRTGPNPIAARSSPSA